MDRLALAHDLLRIGAVELRPSRPFTWASGRLSPIYTDNRLTLSYPEVRARIADGFAERCAELDLDAVAGTATAGIAHAAFLAERLALPMCYVRSAAKGHGRENRIEGRVETGARLVVVEDLVSTGGSVLSAADALREVRAVPVAALAVFSYGLAAAEHAFEDAGLELHTLTGFDELREAAASRLSADELAALDAWRADPAAWSRARGGA